MRSVLALFAAACLLAAQGAYTPATAATPTFTDIAGHPFKGDITWAAEAGITSGCTPTRFCPDELVTREQMASFLVRMFGLPPAAHDYFADDASSLHQGDINRVAAANVASGCGSGRYCPSAVVNREQMASFIVRATKLSTGAGRNYFYDDNNSLHQADIDRLAAGGVGSGCDTWQFCPNGAVTRGQMVAFLHRIIAPVVPPPYPAPAPPSAPTPAPTPRPNCDPAYPTVCIPSPPPDLDCPEIAYRNFKVVSPDPHRFDGDRDGIGCET